MFDPFVAPWTVTHQPPLSMGFPRQEYRSGMPFLSSGDLPDPGIKPTSSALQADSLPSEPPGNPLYSYLIDSYVQELRGRFLYTNILTSLLLS